MPEALQIYVESLPSTHQLREQLARNLQERDLIKRLLKLVEHKEKLEGIKREERSRND